MNYNKISVITPSFNQGRFIEKTILSVIGQQYPNLEYIIMDGGSTDETIAVIKKYEQSITYWESGKDGGQSDAINKGFARATGDILCWLNSDDFYLPGTLLEVNKVLNIRDAELLHGNCLHLNESVNFTHGSYFDQFDTLDINEGSFIAQPSSFWTSKANQLAGELRTDLHFGFDWEWYARAFANGVKFVPTDHYFSVYRLHKDQKSNDSDMTRFAELCKIGMVLKPQKYQFLDSFIAKHSMGIKFIYKMADGLGLSRFEYRMLKLFYPALMRIIDRITLRTYIKLKETADLKHSSG